MIGCDTNPQWCAHYIKQNSWHNLIFCPNWPRFQDLAELTPKLRFNPAYNSWVMAIPCPRLLGQWSQIASGRFNSAQFLQNPVNDCRRVGWSSAIKTQSERFFAIWINSTASENPASRGSKSTLSAVARTWWPMMRIQIMRAYSTKASEVHAGCRRWWLFIFFKPTGWLSRRRSAGNCLLI